MEDYMTASETEEDLDNSMNEQVPEVDPIHLHDEE